MSETMKINLTKTLTVLSIVSVVGGLIWGTAIAYAGLESRIDRIEMKQEKFEGIMEERTRNMDENVKELKSDMKLLLNKLQLKSNGGEQ